MTGNPLQLFRQFFGAVRAIFWLWGSFLPRDKKIAAIFFICWGVAKGSSVSWVAKFKGDKNSECKLSNGWSQSYKVINMLLSAVKASFCSEMSGHEVGGR